MRNAVISEQGRRWSMEDRYTLISDFGGRGWIFAGVYDGHRGSTAAEYAARHLHERLFEFLESGEHPEAAAALAYEAVAGELRDEESGCTAATFLLQEASLTTANCGDSRILLIREETTLQLSQDHRLDNEAERLRIEASGTRISYPYVMSGFQGLMPTRSLGDATFRKAGIIAEPWTQTRPREHGDRFLLAGCDGLFDHLDNETVGAFARTCLDAEDLVQTLKSEVLRNRMGSDNLTIIACDLQAEASPRTF